MLFSLKHHETFDSLKSESFYNCPASVGKTVGIFYCQHKSLMQLSKTSWEHFEHLFQKRLRRQQIEAWPGDMSCNSLPKSTIFNSNASELSASHNLGDKKSMLALIEDKGWSPTHISTLSKNQRQLALQLLVWTHLKDSQCRSCERAHTVKTI